MFLKMGLLSPLIFILGPILLAQEHLVIRNGTLLDVRDGSLAANTYLVLRGDRIVSVDTTSRLPDDAIVVDAEGQYILPGLIDPHAHYKSWAAELYLNHGVTSVLDLGNSHEWIKAQKEGIQSGRIPGPRLFISTNTLDGSPENETSYFRRSYLETVEDPEEAEAAMERYRVEGVDAVKVYEGLSESVLRVLVEKAKLAGIPVMGHFKDVRMAVQVGANGIEHNRAVANAIVDEEARDKALKQVRRGFYPPPESFMDLRRLPEIVGLMVRNGLYLNPTMRVSWQGDRALRDKNFHLEDFELLVNDWRLRYVPLAFRMANLKEYQEIGLWHWRDLSQYEQDLFHQGYRNAQRLLKEFADAGGKLYAGTDCANMCVPGLGTHQELELMVAAGVSPLKALQAATINSAELMRIDDRLGTLEEGKAADVLILEANPLENIRHTRRISQVISRGKILDGEYHAEFTNPIPRDYWEDSDHYFPSPEIRSIGPEAIEEGAKDITLMVQGTGFIPYSILRFGPAKLETEWISEFELRGHIDPALLRVGTYPVRVENPDFAGGSIYARGASDLAHMGIRPHISNVLQVVVKPRGGAAIFPRPQPLGEN